MSGKGEDVCKKAVMVVPCPHLLLFPASFLLAWQEERVLRMGRKTPN